MEKGAKDNDDDDNNNNAQSYPCSGHDRICGSAGMAPFFLTSPLEQSEWSTDMSGPLYAWGKSPR
jgi:hypothetical protein